VKSLRLDQDLEQRPQRAASVLGETLSEFIRRAAVERTDDFADVLGVVNGRGGRARNTGGAFTDVIAEAESSG